MYKSAIVIIFSVVLLSACGIYSFTGASIPKEANTITIEYFSNKAPTVQPILSQVFTEKLKDRFIEQTDLVLSENGDLSFNGYISDYNIKPIAITSNETASKNRLTIKVNVVFKSIFNEKSNFEQSFSRYKDYDSSEEISNIEEELINQICDELVEDIFNKSFVNW